MRAYKVDLQLANLLADVMHIAQFADASRDCVRNFIIGDERVNDGTSTVDGLARVGIEENGPANVGLRHFAHRFESEIVSVDVQGLQGSSQFSVSWLSVVGRSPLLVWFTFGSMLPVKRSRFVSGHRFSDAASSRISCPLGAAHRGAKHFHIFLRQRARHHL